MVLLSGPENQRSKFHEGIINSPYFNTKNLLIYGNNYSVSNLPNHTENGVVDGIEIGKSFNKKNIVIARSGYSSIMDLAYLGAKAIYIPTPGLSEQVYLAKLLASHFSQITIKQKDLKKERPDIFKNIKPLNIDKKYFEFFKSII